MKGVGIVVALVLFSVLTSCNKENKTDTNQTFELPEVTAAASGQSIYASAWQTLEGWEKTEGLYQARQHLPIKPNGGKVLLFARNVWAADAPMEELMEDMALQLPFNFLPYTAKPGLTETWNYQLGDNEVKIDLKVEGGELEPRPVQVRCIYIPETMWEKLKSESLEGLAYESLVTKLNLQP
jgi:hypothetical protein